MNYRYFYNAQGAIVGVAEYSVVCMCASMSDSAGYVDSTIKIDASVYQVDLTNQTLVAQSQ
jgi:hypothetical protein